MASLNTMRTKYGVILSVIIGGALLAFVLSLRDEMGFTGNDPEVCEIGGDAVTASEFSVALEEVKTLTGEASTDQEVLQQISSTLQSLTTDRVFVPAFNEMGLTISQGEYSGILRGEHKSDVLSMYFGNPQTATLDVAALSDFIARAQTDPQAQRVWNVLKKQILFSRQAGKFSHLTRKSAYANNLEVEQGVKAANTTYDGRYVRVRYSDVADSLVSVSDSEIKAYYNAHKKQYKQTPFRSISYVEFEVEPTEADKSKIEADVNAAAEKFSKAIDLVAFSRENRDVKIAPNYIVLAQLSEAESKTLSKGRMYGPELVGNEWRATRVLDSRNVADSLTLKNIVLNYNDKALADSLLGVLKSRKAKFEDLAAQYSIAENAANGGEIGTVAYSEFGSEFADALNGKRVGDVVLIDMPNNIQLVKVVKLGKMKKHLRLATLEVPVVASGTTDFDVRTLANNFALSAKGSVDKFNQTASAGSLSSRSININRGERNVRGIDGSSIGVVRWAGEAEIGDVSDVIKVGNNYVVAVLTAVNDAEYRPLSEVSNNIKNLLLNDKKFEYLAAKLQGETIDAVAEAVDEPVIKFEDAKSGGPLTGAGSMELRVMGALSALESGKLSAPIKGRSGAFVVVVDAVDTVDEPQTAEAEKVKAQATAERNATMAFPSLMQSIEVKDNTPMYF